MTATTNRRSDLTRPDGTALRVLVVDDESTLSELLSMTLRYEGWRCRRPPTAWTRSAPPGRSAPTP